MTLKKFVNTIDQINRSFDIGRTFNLNNIKDLKFNLDEKIDKNVCFKFSSFNIILINEEMNSIKFDEDVVKDKMLDCDYVYFILAVSLKNNFHHVTSLIVDHKSKKVVLFDNANNEFIKKSSKYFLKKINLNYKLISTNMINKINVKKLDICSVCVPISLFYIYININYKVKVDEFISFLLKNSVKYNTELMHKFVVFLEND
jgi:hypothetical protein